ncbi:hypothetical protein MTO96_009046 [Rhipicephalus appendiculatus]
MVNYNSVSNPAYTHIPDAPCSAPVCGERRHAGHPLLSDRDNVVLTLAWATVDSRLLRIIVGSLLNEVSPINEVQRVQWKGPGVAAALAGSGRVGSPEIKSGAAYRRRCATPPKLPALPITGRGLSCPSLDFGTHPIPPPATHQHPSSEVRSTARRPECIASSRYTAVIVTAS